MGTVMGTSNNDTLIGSAGADTLEGGAGDDFYIVDNAGDAVAEATGQGWDTIRSSISYALSASNEIEALELAGSAISATGNALENLLIGSALDNVLDGGQGGDFLSGGAGNDTYIVDDIGDEVYEKANAGVDTIKSSVSFDLRLSRHAENLTLTGAAALDGLGNMLNNLIVGNQGNNRLNGGLRGNDTLEGQDGSDTYVFSGRFGSDVVRDKQAPTAPVPVTNTTPVFGGGSLTDLGGSLTFSPDLLNSLNVGTGTGSFTNANVVTLDTFNVLNGGTLDFTSGAFVFNNGAVINDMGVVGGGGLSTGGGNLTISDTFSDSFTFTGFGSGLTPEQLDAFGLSFTLNPFDLVTVDQWDERPNTDALRFSDVSYDKLWFKQIGQDLEVSVVGATDKVTVRDWYTGQDNKIELSYDAGNAHVLRYDKVQSLVTAMAGFSPQALSGNATLTAARDAAWVVAA